MDDQVVGDLTKEDSLLKFGFSTGNAIKFLKAFATISAAPKAAVEDDAAAMPSSSDDPYPDEAKAAATAKAAAALSKATAEAKPASVPEKKLTQAQLAAAVAAVSKTRGKPILRSRISFVGEGAAGKTSVIRAICSEADGDPKSTIGIDRSCAEFDISAVNVEAVGGEVCCSRCVQLITALSVACALQVSAVEYESICRHSIQ